jgi:hypothetical protein
MATATDLITEKTIRAAAIAAGYADALVDRYVEQRPYHFEGEPLPLPKVWFLLSVQRSVGSEFELMGRRRTKAELMGLIRSR